MEIHPERTVELTDLNRDDRRRLRPWVGLVLAGAFLALMAWASRSYAQDIPLHVLDKDGISISLMDLPCVDARSIMMIRPDALARFKAVKSTWPEKDGSRKEYGGCWAELTAEESGSVEGFLVVFSDGESGFIAKSEFKKTRGQVGV